MAEDLKFVLRADTKELTGAVKRAEGAIKGVTSASKTAGTSTAASAGKATDAVKKLGVSGLAAGAAVKKGSGQAGKATGQLGKTSTTTGRYLSQMGASGRTAGTAIASSSRQASKATGQIGKAGSAAGVSLNKLSLALATSVGGIYGIARAVSAAIATVDKLKALENRLRLVTEGERDLVAVQKDLFEISQRSRTGLAETTELYARVAVAAGDLGRDQGELLQLTEAVSKAVALSGASSSEASAGIIQFSQALASGRLQGDELRSVLENLPGLAREIAAGLGVPIGEIRQLAAEGKLTANEIVNAILSRKGEIEAAYASFTPTVAQSFEVLGSSSGRFLQLLDETTGATDKLSQGLVLVSDTINDWSNAIAHDQAREGLLDDLKKIKDEYDELRIAIEGATIAQLDLYEVRLQKPLADASREAGHLQSQLDAAQAKIVQLEQQEANKSHRPNQEINRNAVIASTAIANLHRINPEVSYARRDEIERLKRLIAKTEETLSPINALISEHNNLLKEIDEQRRLLGDNKSLREPGKRKPKESTPTITDEQRKQYQRELKQQQAELRAGLLAETEERIVVLQLRAEQEKRVAAEKYQALGASHQAAADHERLIEENLQKDIDEVRSRAAKQLEKLNQAEAERIKKEHTELASLRQERQNSLSMLEAQTELEQQIVGLQIQQRETIEEARQRGIELSLSANELAREELLIKQRTTSEIAKQFKSAAREKFRPAIKKASLSDAYSARTDALTNIASLPVSPEIAAEMRRVLETEYGRALHNINQLNRPAWQKLTDEWGVAANSMGDALERAFTRGIQAGEAVFENFVRTGKLSISGLSNIIIEELSRAFYRSQIAPLLSTIGGSVFGSLVDTGASNSAPAGYYSFTGYHTGGLVGADNTHRQGYLPAAAFANAPRLHDGGVLKADEVPAVLKRGEGVFTPAQMRNLAPTTSAPKNIKVEIRNEGLQPQQIVSATPTVRGQDLVVQVVTEDVGRNGPISKTIATTFNLRRGNRG